MDWRLGGAVLCIIIANSLVVTSTNYNQVAAIFNIVFHINETYTPTLANTSSSEFVAKAKIITDQLVPICNKSFNNFIRIIIHNFRNGSIVTNCSFEFSANGTIPTDSTIQKVLVNETTNNTSLKIIANSINVTKVSETSTNATLTNITSLNTISTNATLTNVTSTNATSTNAISTNASSTNATSTNATSTNATSTNATSTNASSTNASSTNTTSTNATSTNATSTNATLTNATSTNATSTNVTSTNEVFNMVFSIDEPFDEALSNNSSPMYKARCTQIRNLLEPIYKELYSNFINAIINGFSNGSIVTNCSLEFNTNGTVPTDSTIQNTIVNSDTIKSSLKIIANSITVTKITETRTSTTNTNSTNATLTNATLTNATLTNATSTNATSTNVTSTNEVFNMVFSIDEPFDEALSNNSSPMYKARCTQIRNLLEPIYKELYSNFINAIINGFRNGSIVTNCSLEFSANGTIPTDSTIQNTLVTLATMNSSLKIIPNSITVTKITGTNTSTTNTTPQKEPTVYSLIFSIDEPFDSALASMCSQQFATKSKNITGQVERMYKKAFSNFMFMRIEKYSGSITTESKLFMDSSGPKVTIAQVKDTFLYALNSFTFKVDPASVRVNQITTPEGNSMSPVVTGSVSLIWMSLFSLLLSLAVHY